MVERDEHDLNCCAHLAWDYLLACFKQVVPIGDPATCFPVWPYNGACVDTSQNSDFLRAEATRQNASTANRVDTVAIGAGFVGALFGFNYQIVKNFGVFGEVQVGGWFPQNASVLFDINVGPAITF